MHEPGSCGWVVTIMTSHPPPDLPSTTTGRFLEPSPESKGRSAFQTSMGRGSPLWFVPSFMPKGIVGTDLSMTGYPPLS